MWKSVKRKVAAPIWFLSTFTKQQRGSVKLDFCNQAWSLILSTDANPASATVCVKKVWAEIVLIWLKKQQADLQIKYKQRKSY